MCVCYCVSVCGKERKQAEIETEIRGVLRKAGLLTTQGGDGCVGS